MPDVGLLALQPIEADGWYTFRLVFASGIVLVCLENGVSMSDGNTHKLVGAGAGAVFAGFRAKEQKDHHWCAEVAGGALGGYIAGQLPDLLEPAISSWHRDVAHSYSAGGGIIALGNALAAFVAACRENAEKCEAIPMEQQGDKFVPVAVDPFSKFLLDLFALLWRLAAGFANGLAAGYISHLALDAVTPRSIPLLTSAGQRRVATAQRARCAKLRAGKK